MEQEEKGMIEIEQAIYLLREGAENWRYTSQEWLDDKDAEAISLAIEALKEKTEREKGCEWCDDHNYKQPSEWIWGERIHTIKPHYFCVGDGITRYEEAEYCPKCGRKLVSEE